MKKKTWVMLPKSLIAVLIFAAVVTAIYIYDKNLLPVGNVSLKPGKYVWDQDSKASITISEDGRMTFENMDLDHMLVGFRKFRLNETFIGEEKKFILTRGLSGVYSLSYYLSEEDRMEVDYYPREDKLLLFKPQSEEWIHFYAGKVILVQKNPMCYNWEKGVLYENRYYEANGNGTVQKRRKTM